MATTSHPSLGERIRWAGWTAWMLIGLLLLGNIVYRYAVRPLSVLFVPVAIAIVIVYLLNPLVNTLVRRGVRRGWAVLFIYIAFLIVLVVVLNLLIPLIGRQVSAFVDEVPRYVDRVTTEINQIAERRGYDFRVRIDSQQIIDSLQTNRETVLRFLGGVRSVAGQVLHLVVTLLIGIILSIYLLLDLPKVQRAVVNAIPPAHRDETIQLLDKIGGALGGFFRGQLFVAAFVGVASAVGLSLVKLPFAVLIGLVAGVFNLIPLIGPFLAAVPAVVIGLLSDRPIRALYAAIVLLIVQQIDNHIVSPNVMGRTVRLHPITVMLALLAGGTIAGIPGMLIVIPIVAATKILAQHLWSKRERLGVPATIADSNP